MHLCLDLGFPSLLVPVSSMRSSRHGHRRAVLTFARTQAILVQRYYRKKKSGKEHPPTPPSVEGVAAMDRFVESVNEDVEASRGGVYSASPEEKVAARKILRFLKQCIRQGRTPFDSHT
jgi:hypothetical protein